MQNISGSSDCLAIGQRLVAGTILWGGGGENTTEYSLQNSQQRRPFSLARFNVMQGEQKEKNPTVTTDNNILLEHTWNIQA